MVANELFLNTPEKAMDWLRENGNEICNTTQVETNFEANLYCLIPTLGRDFHERTNKVWICKPNG